MKRLARDWRVKLYDAGARLYGFFTSTGVWQRVNTRLVAHFPEHTRRVLDVGCGTGATVLAEARACPGATVVGVDISGEMIARAKRAIGPDLAARVSVMVADAARLPFERASFDVVTGHSFLYLLQDRADVLAEVARVLRPGGRAIFMEPRRGGFSPSDVLAVGKDVRFLVSMSMWRVMSAASGRFRASELLALLEGAGLAPLGSEEVLGGLGVLAVAEKPAS